MTDDKNKRKLYDALSKDYDMGTFEQFSTDVEDEGKRRKLYDAIKGEYDLPDFEGFSTQLIGSSTTHQPTMTQPAGTVSAPVSVSGNGNIYQMAQPNVPQYEYGGKTPAVEAKEKEEEKPLGPEKFAKQMEMGEMVRMRQKEFSQRMENIRQGNQPFSSGKVQRVNAETGKIEDVYLTKGGDEVGTAFEQSQANKAFDREQQVRNEVETLSKRLDVLLEDAQQRAYEKFSKSEEVKYLTDKDVPFFKRVLAAFRLNNNNRHVSQMNTPEVQSVRAAQRMLGNANRIIAEADRHAQLGDYDNWFRGVGRGFANSAKNVENWDFGMSSLIDNVSLMDALNKADKGEQLTEIEQALLDAAVTEIAVNNYFGSEVSRGYKAGQVTAESLPFMIEMLINPASGAGKSAGAKMARYALKRFGKESVAKGGKKYATSMAMKVGGRVLGDIAGSSTMTATTGQIGTAADAFERVNRAKMNGNELDLGKAYAQAFKSRTIENYSEMLGNYFSPALKYAGKGIDGLALTKFGQMVGLEKVMNFVEDVSSSELSKIITDFEQHANWHGTIGEYVEEVAGNVLNGIFVGDMTFDNDKDTGIFNLDNNIDTFLGVAVLGGVFSASKTVGYGAQKINGYISKYDARKRMEASEMNARSAFSGNEASWDAIRETLEFGNVGDVKSTLEEVVANPDYTDEQKRAVFDYAEKATSLKGVLISEQKRMNSEDTNEVDAVTNQSYDKGYEADDETRRDIGIAYGMAKEGDADYDEKKAAWDGVVARINDEADEQMAIEREQGLKMKNPDGNIRPVTLKEKDEDGNDKEAFIIDGNVVMMADGTMVDSEASDNMVVIYDPSTGEKHQVPPTDILSVGEATSWKDYDAELTRRRDEYVQKAMDDAQGTVRVELGQQLTMPDGRQGVVMAISPDGERFTVVAEDGSDQVEMERSDLQQVYDNVAMADYQERHPEEQQQPAGEPSGTVAAESPTLPDGHVQGAPTEFLPDMEIGIMDEEGNVHPAIVRGPVRSIDSKYYVPDANGKMIEYMVGGEVKHDWIDDLSNKVVSFVPDAQTTETLEEKQPVGKPSETVAEQGAETVTEQTAEEPQGEVSLEEQPAVAVMPVREDGEADYMATTPERGHQYIYNEAGLSREEAGQFVKANIEAAEKALKKLQGKAPKMGTSIQKYRQEKAVHQQQLEEAQRVVDYWNGVKAEQEKIMSEEAKMKEAAAVEALRERMAKESQRHEEAVLAEQQRQAEELAKQQEQAERGANAVHPAIREKWDAAPKVEGVENEITLANGETVKGRYMLVESGAATPSHNPNMGFARNEGFPVDENGQTVNDRDYERDRNAQQITRDMADRYDSRAVQSVPVVSQDGVVLSGNGRTMAGEIASQQGSDGAYIEHLKRYPQQFGFTPEQVGTMQHPRVVFVPDEAMPYTTETFAKFNAQDMKSQSKTEQSVKLGKTVDDATFGRIVSSINVFDTLGDFYNDAKAAPAAIGELNKAGVINQMQMAEMMDGDKISGVGRQMLESMLIGKAFEGNPDAVRQLSEFPSMRQSVVSALAEVANNIKLGEDYSLESEMAQAIDLAYQARKSGTVGAGEKVSAFARQGNLFAFDEGDTVADYTNATIMMLADCINDSRVSRLKNVLALYNDKATESAAGQYDMFSGDVKGKEEIIKDVLNILDYGTKQEKREALAGAAERRKGQSVQEDGAAATGGAGIGEPERLADIGRVATEGGLSEDEADDLILLSADRAKPMPQKELTPETWASEFVGGVVTTPLGDVKMGQNQYSKMIEKGRKDEFGMIKPTLSDPDFIIEEVSDAKDGSSERASSYLFVKSFIGKDGKKRYFFKSVTVQKDGLEIVISNHIDTAKRLRESLKKGKLLYRFDGGAQTEQTQASASVTTSQDVMPGSLSNETVAKTEPQQLNNVNSGDSSLSEGEINDITPTEPNGEPTVSSGKGMNISETEQEKVASNSNSESVEHKEGDITYEEKEKDGVKTTKFTRYRKAKSGAVKAITGGGAFINPTLVNREYLNEEEFGQVEKVELIELREYNGKYGGTVRVYRDGYAPTILEVSFDKNPISSVQTTNAIASAEAEVDTDPTEGQKKAGNYKMGHVSVEGYDITIENPKGSVRRGTDPNGKAWEQEMHNTYGYIRGTEGVDGDHIDVFLSDDPTQGDVFVVDQVDPSTGKFDEHKVMYGFADAESAKAAYLSNYEEGWQGLGEITHVSKEEFKKWVDSSHRKTKPFADYKNVKVEGAQNDGTAGETAGTVSDDSQGSIFNNVVDVDRSGNLRKSLVEAYKGGNREAIKQAVEDIKQYLDEGKDFDSEYSEDVEDYEGNDPEMLADRFITHALHDRYLDTDEDQGYIKTGIRSDVAGEQGNYTITPKQYTTKRGNVLDMHLVKFSNELDAKERRAAIEMAKEEKGWWSREDGGFLMRSEESAKRLAERIMKGGEAVEDAQPISIKEVESIVTSSNSDKKEKKEPTKERDEETHKIVSTSDYEEALKTIRDWTNRLNMGVPPDVMLAAFKVSAYHIESGVRKLADFAKKMIELFGDNIRPYIKQFYTSVMFSPELSAYQDEFTPLNEVQEFDALNFDKTMPAGPIETAQHIVNEQKIENDVKTIENEIKKRRESKKSPKNDSEAAVQQSQLSLFREEEAPTTEKVETKNKDNDENTNVQSGTSEAGRGGYKPQSNAEVGRSAGDETKRPVDQGVAGRNQAHPGDNGERSGRVSGVLAGDNRVEKPVAEQPKRNLNNNHVERGTDFAPKDVDRRIEANIAAIEKMQELMEEGRQATPQDMEILRKFSGWGGLGKAFQEKGYGYGYDPMATSKRLKALLGDEAYEQANMSRNSAYYTPAKVIDTLWDIAKAMGFKGGKVLEGSAGIGNIIGLMPHDMSERSDIHAVEIDSTTGNILKLLYPDAKVEVQGFESTQVENGSVDLAITNVPFVTGLRVSDTTGDKDLSKKFKDIHDFCIAKNIRKLREGGIGIFITSSSTLDSSTRLREWVVQEGGADVVGAFRLNNDTFGGTVATSDIIVVRKRVNGQKSPNAIDVLTTTGERTADYDTGETKKVKGESVPIIKQLSMDYNKYFVEHPEMMGGEMKFGFEKDNNYRPTSKSLYPVKEKNQSEMLEAFVRTFDGKVWDKAVENSGEDQNSVVYSELGKNVKEGSIVVSNGRLCMAQFGYAKPLMSSPNEKKGEVIGKTITEEELIKRFQDKKVKGHTKVQCFESYKAIKDALASLLEYQTTNETDDGLQPLLDALNRAFDTFVKTYGHLHKNTSISFLKNDVDYSNILALEKFNERIDPKSGERIPEYGKTDVFSRRVVDKDKEPEPDNVKDGIIASIYVHGRVNVPWIAETVSQHTEQPITEQQVIDEIINTGLGFENPSTRQIEVSYEYLSGNVREKLQQAIEANADGRYNSNIKALEKVIPMNIPAHLIDFSIGSSWIDQKLYEEYVKEKTNIDVTFVPAGGTWFMKKPSFVEEQKNRAFGIVSELLHKTIMGTELIEAAMTNKTITVSETRRRWDGSTETVVDKDATTACANKIDEIRQDFKDWARGKMQSDPDMSARVERIYNEMFNNYVPRTIPDDFVPDHFGGAATVVDGKPFSLRPHQGKAVVRSTTQPLLLAHEVGTGKTYTLITTAMEMRRLGTARKPMIVVQNATVGQFVESAKKLYPNTKVLTIEDKDHTGEGRKSFYAKIKYNDWDMIVVPQSVFERIPDSEERQIAFVQEKIEEKEMVLEQMRKEDPDGKSAIVRDAEREIEKLQDELSEHAENASKKRKERDEKKAAVSRQNAAVKAKEMLDRQTDDVENFDDMGIDALLVDEAHEYKHLGFATAMQRGVKGVDPSFSKKAQGVLLKTQAVMEKNNGRNVVFATGTPISNTAAEIWTFMRYLMSADTMKEYGIYYFDDFVRNFGNLTQMLEFTTSGKFKENNRFAGYVNLPELVRIWSGVADTVLTSEAGGVSDKIPAMEGGKAQDIYLPQTKALRSVMKYVKHELDKYDKMSGKEKKEHSYIPLTMYGIAKAAAVDARLVVGDAVDEEQSKTNEAVRQTLKSLEETKEYKGTIAIFADNYQNKHTGFNLYEDIRYKLEEAGVPAEQIVVMKSGMSVKKKLDIFDMVNRGDVRVIMGSTFTLGTGVNIQERLHTLIHLDAPNRPMDYTQRNGRILRQGNLHKDMDKPVRVLRFGVEDSLDVTAYQRLKTKGAIADSIMNGKKMMNNSMENRVLEEEEDVFGDTVAQLSGSEYAMLKNQAEKDVRKYENKKKQWEADQTYCHNEIPRLESRIRQANIRLDNVKKALEKVEEKKGTELTITIDKQKFADIEAMSDYIKEFNKKIRDTENDMRENPYKQSESTITLKVNVNGFYFIFTTKVGIEFASKQGTLFSAIHRNMHYDCPQLGLEDIPVKQSLLREGLEDIVNNVITGNDFRERIERLETTISKHENELSQVRERDGKPFEYGKELEAAHKHLNEYTELMKKELEEKEKKYSQMDAEVEEANDVTVAEEAEEDAEEDNGIRFRDGDEDLLYRIREESAPTKTGIGYKVFVLKGGELYPPMAANPEGESTPVGVWLNADAAPVIGTTKTGRKQVKAGGKGTQGGSGQLDYRPGWHLGEIPYALQFNRKDAEGNKTLFPANFVWAEVEYANDVDYQDEAMSYGNNANGKFQHSLAGLPFVPENGSYKYRTNPNPETDPWIITGAMKVKRILTPSEVDEMVKAAGREPQNRQEGYVTDEQVKMLNEQIATRNREGDGYIRPTTTYAESLASARRAGYSQRQHDAMLERQERNARKQFANLIDKLGLTDHVELRDTPEGLKGRRAKAKGWYDPTTGKIVIILGNHHSKDDVMMTILHECIGHYGMRELFGTHFYTFLDNVYLNADEGVRREIIEFAKKHGWDFRTATEEYLASLAEDERFLYGTYDVSWWGKIKALFFEMLHKLGVKVEDFGVKLSDNELRYLLWRSYQNLVNPGRFRSLVDEAKDVVMQNTLKVGQFEEESKTEDGEQSEEDLQIVAENTTTFADEAFNAQIDRLASGEMKSNEYITLGMPMGVLSNYMPNDRIILRQKIVTKANKKHGITAESIKNLPSAIADPIFIFKSSDNTISVLTEIKSKDGNNVFVSIGLGVEKQMGHEYLEVNDILTIHGRNVENIIKPIIENESLVYVNKEKARHWLSSVQANGQAVTKEELNSATKILNNFDISEKSKNDVLFRDGEESAFGMESITSAALKLSERHKEDVKLRNDAMQRIGDNLSNLRKVISLQKEFDKGTVKRVTDLANVFINNGLIDEMSAYDVKRLLSAVGTSVGKEDLKENLNKVMDIMISNQLKRAEEDLHRLETVRGSKVDARGVEVQGELDIAGQRMVDAFKKGRRMQKEDIEERMADALNRMGSDDLLEAEEAATEYAGLQMAMDYIDKIQSSINSEEDLKKEMRDEERKIYTFDIVEERDEDGNVVMKKDGSGPRMRTVRHTKPEFKAPMSEANKQLKKQVLETVEAIDDAIRKGRAERVQEYTDLVGRLSGTMRKSMENALAFKEAERERVREIQHNANSDMEGRPSKEHSAKAETFLKRLNNGAGNTVFAPLGTFVEMLRMFGSKSANGEGYLFNRFARGLIDSRQKEIRGVRDKYKQLDEKAREVFGGDVKRWADVMKEAGKGEKINVGFWDGGQMEDHELHQGNLMYIYMVNKMTDGRMKLRKMGVTEDVVEYITERLDPRLKTLADWIQDEFLPQSRKEYNETHKRMFGAPMASVENYFPLKILANARTDKPEDLDAPEMNDVISTKTGSVIKRKTNTLALDLMGADALHVVLDHVAEMEHWNAFAEYNRDLNTLRTYKHFRNQVQNMTSIYGNGKELWNKFNELCQIAVGSYRPKHHKLDKVVLEFAQGVTASKVSLRINTALKQFLSLPAYLPYINVRGFASSIASNIRNKEASFKWCMENLPMFEERWMSRVSGDPRLAKVAMDWKSGRANFVKNVALAGMLPNAFVDALTVSIGAHAVYETRLDQYIREGYPREVAERRAIQDAEIAYNETQQSSEGGFVSTVQVDRTWLSVMFTIFRNASMSYQRQLHGALRNIWNNRTKEKREQTIAFETKQLVREGIDEEAAKEVAKERLGRQMTKNALAVATFSFIVQLAWNTGGYMWYLLFGDDDDEKDAMWEDIYAHTLFGPFEGLVGGDVMSELGRQIVMGDFNPKTLDKDMPLSSDLMRTGEYIGRGDYAAALEDIINIIVSAGIGMNPQSITDAVLASFDRCRGDMALTHEAVIWVSRVLQVPQSQVEKLYFDEIDLIGKDVSKYTFEQLIERYAKYKTKRGYLYTPWLWDDEEIIKNKADYMGKTVIKERTGMTMKQHEAYDKKRHQDIQAPNKDKDIDESYNKIADVYDELKKTDFAEKYRRIAMLRSGYEDAMKRSYVEAAQIMAELQTEEEKFHKENPTLVNFEGYAGKEDEEERRWHSYILFDSMEKNLKKIDKRYRDEETPEEEKEMLAEVIQIYKKGIVNMLNAQTEDELKRWQDKLNNEIATYQNRF